MKTKYIYLLCFCVFLLIIWSSIETKTAYSSITQLKLTSKKVNLNTLTIDSFKKYSLQLIKTKEEPLLISKIETSSKSINIQQTLQYFPKGDTISIPFVFHTKSLKGSIQESITLYGNFPEEHITIPVSCYVK